MCKPALTPPPPLPKLPQALMTLIKSDNNKAAHEEFNIPNIINVNALYHTVTLINQIVIVLFCSEQMMSRSRDINMAALGKVNIELESQFGSATVSSWLSALLKSCVMAREIQIRELPQCSN